MPQSRQFLRLNMEAVRDLAPIVLVIGMFQLLLVQQPLPEFASILLGLIMVVLGLALFVQGLDIALFPLGECLADAVAGLCPIMSVLALAAVTEAWQQRRSGRRAGATEASKPTARGAGK